MGNRSDKKAFQLIPIIIGFGVFIKNDICKHEKFSFKINKTPLSMIGINFNSVFIFELCRKQAFLEKKNLFFGH